METVSHKPHHNSTEVLERSTSYEAAQMAINSVIEEIRAERAARSADCEGRTNEAVEAAEENSMEAVKDDGAASSIPSTPSLIDDTADLSDSVRCSNNRSGRDDKENRPVRARIGTERYGLRTLSDFTDDERPALFEHAKKIANKAEFSSFDEFLEAFEPFKICGNHPFRVASSEKFRDGQNNQDDKFQYKYILLVDLLVRESRQRLTPRSIFEGLAVSAQMYRYESAERTL
ncbi:unnamed protein product [Gongylonema pulchrum]|uniref:DDE_Tnp_1_7 domain-containing protein n=1 Tax=Gongylonema pulchrum TaxID=637853 RepID=A0A183D6W6_9BILA|nr:unnamed protein product [Gongylonema pulchrum]